jgi:hypothetical protein
MFNKKAVWTLREYVISLLVLSAIISIAYVMVGSLAVTYDTPNIVDSDFSANYDKFSQQTAMMQDIKNATVNGDGLTILNAGDILFKSTIAVVRLIFDSIGTVTLQVLSFGTDFGIPTEIWVIVSILFITILTALVIFAIINALNKQGVV